MDFTTAPVVSAITDRYDGLSIKVAATRNDPAFEVTYVKVEVEPMDDGVYVTATAHGYKLTKTGNRVARGGVSQMYGVRDAEDRHELIRAAAQATLDRHRVTARVQNVDLRPWAEVKAADEAWLIAKYGKDAR